jgi:putative flavoprotein involved in K+ transport
MTRFSSGCQIATELSATHSVDLSIGKRIPTIPQRPFGRDVWSWATALHLDRVSIDSGLGQRLAGGDQNIGAGPKQIARRHGVRLRPRMTGISDRTVTFADDGTAEFNAVVWATGFTSDNSWVNIPGVIDERGRLRQSRGVTPSPVSTRSASLGSTPEAPP